MQIYKTRRVNNFFFQILSNNFKNNKDTCTPRCIGKSATALYHSASINQGLYIFSYNLFLLHESKNKNKDTDHFVPICFRHWCSSNLHVKLLPNH